MGRRGHLIGENDDGSAGHGTRMKPKEGERKNRGKKQEEHRLGADCAIQNTDEAETSAHLRRENNKEDTRDGEH